MSLFPEYCEETAEERTKERERKKWAKRKLQNFGTERCVGAMHCGRYGIPQIAPYNGPIPENFITLSEITKTGSNRLGVSSFDYDYVIDRLWYSPDDYVGSLSNYVCFCEPDFSLRIGDPLAVQIANTWRSHVLAFDLQRRGVKMLPNMSWASPQSYEFCFDGHSKGGAVMVSTIGTMRDERSRMYFSMGFKEMLKRISPDVVLLYGDVNEDVLALMPSCLEVRQFSHNRFRGAREVSAKGNSRKDVRM